jgi:hypothetical protein
MKSGCRSCALAAASSSALGINRRKITHTSTSRWTMPVRSSAPIALRYSASIRAWAHTKLIRQIVLTVIRTELNCSNAASFVMPAAANQRQAPSHVRFGSRLCENAKTLNRDRRSYSFKTVLVAQRAGGFNLEIELKNIILRRVSIFEFLHSQGHLQTYPAQDGVSASPLKADIANATCNVGYGPRLCENAKTLNRDRRSYSFKTVLVAQRASGFNLEIELKNIILRRVSIFEFSHSQGHKQTSDKHGSRPGLMWAS